MDSATPDQLARPQSDLRSVNYSIKLGLIELSADSISPRSDCADIQAYLEPQCLHTVKDSNSLAAPVLLKTGSHLQLFIYLIDQGLEEVEGILLFPDVDWVPPQLEHFPELLWFMKL